MTTGDKFVSIQPKRLMGFLDFRDRFLDYVKERLAKITEVAYGDDGTVGGSITMSEFGSGIDRFQLDNDIIGSDGAGNFTLADAELAGRDVGFQFENANAVDYHVAYHYTERPRGIQINPRTGDPEFKELEETLGNRIEPDLVTDNGTTITFRVNSATRLYAADAALDQTGRRCLVWKKTPGRTAIIEALAVELLTVTNNGGEMEVTSSGLFGQTVGSVSTTPSDYYVLLLGASLSIHTLASEPGYHYIGKITGAGSGSAPSFDLTGQLNIGPIISDINVISELHHGNRKLRTKADNSDVDETQLEIQGRPDAGFPIVFSVDEDGDMRVEGTSGFGGVPDATKLIKLHGIALPGEVEGQMEYGAGLTAGGSGVTDALPRHDFGTLTSIYYHLINQWTASDSTITRLYAKSGGGGKGFAWTHNADYDYATDNWRKDQDGNEAWSFETDQGLISFLFREAANNGTWDSTARPSSTTGWDMRLRLNGASGGTHGLETFGTTELGNDLWDTTKGAIDSDALIARLIAKATNTTADGTYSLMGHFQRAGGSTPTGDTRIYITKEGELVVTTNCSHDGTDWAKDVTGVGAQKFVLGKKLQLFTRYKTDNTDWTDAEWYHPSVLGTPVLEIDNDASSSPNSLPEVVAYFKLLSLDAYSDIDITTAGDLNISANQVDITSGKLRPWDGISDIGANNLSSRVEMEDSRISGFGTVADVSIGGAGPSVLNILEFLSLVSGRGNFNIYWLQNLGSSLSTNFDGLYIVMNALWDGATELWSKPDIDQNAVALHINFYDPDTGTAGANAQIRFLVHGPSAGTWGTSSWGSQYSFNFNNNTASPAEAASALFYGALELGTGLTGNGPLLGDEGEVPRLTVNRVTSVANIRTLVFQSSKYGGGDTIRLYATENGVGAAGPCLEFTIRAKWDDSASQWTDDGESGNSYMLMFSQNSTYPLQLLSHPSAIATWSDALGSADWTRMSAMGDGILASADVDCRHLVASGDAYADKFVAVDNEDGFEFDSGTRTFYRTVGVGEALWANYLTTGEIYTITNDPSGAGKPSAIDVGVSTTLVADTEIQLPIQVPDGVTLTSIRLYLYNGGTLSTEVYIARETLSDLSTTPKTSLLAAGTLALPSVGIGTGYTDVAPDQNNIIDNSYSYYLSIKVKASKWTVIRGARFTFTTDHMVF